jgi:transcriptional regulator with XRE-family HTH domain
MMPGLASAPQWTLSDGEQASVSVDIWTGREVRALRLARRMSVRQMGAHLGVSDRMVSKWEAGGTAIQPRPVNQAALDTSLALAPAEVKRRFAHIIRGSDPQATPHQRQPLLTELPEGPRHIARHPIDGKLMTIVDAGPYHPTPDREPVWLCAYYIDVQPITNGDYARFLKATSHQRPTDWDDMADVHDPNAGNPVVEVSFEDACAYAFWASKAIPTSDEWDRAAQGTEGMTVVDMWEWCWTEAGPKRRGRKDAGRGGFRCVTPAPEMVGLLGI